MLHGADLLSVEESDLGFGDVEEAEWYSEGEVRNNCGDLSLCFPIITVPNSYC